MKSLTGFFKTSIIGGLFVLLPLLLVYLLLSEAVELAVALSTPIADLFPKGTFDAIEYPVATALILIVGASFLIGLALHSEIGRRLGRWIERTTLDRLPAYGAIKSLTNSFKGVEAVDGFKPAVLTSSQGGQEIVYVIEEHGDGKMTILVPWAPTPFAGSVKIVPSDELEMMNATVGEASRVLSHWGVGVSKLLGKGRKE
jgi:uncharacterized membrane protein